MTQQGKKAAINEPALKKALSNIVGVEIEQFFCNCVIKIHHDNIFHQIRERRAGQTEPEREVVDSVPIPSQALSLHHCNPCDHRLCVGGAQLR